VFGVAAPVGKIVAVVLMCVAGLVALTQIDALRSERDRAADRKFLLAGLCFLALWAELAVTFAHADDVLAIMFTLFALRALRADRPYLGALLLALAADCKPWAAIFVPLLLLAEHRARARALAVWVATILLAWLPFYLGDRRTLSASGFRIVNDRASSLRLFGVHASSTPTWDRPAQFALAIALGAALMWRGRWAAVIVVAVAARILLDPSIKSYYDAGLLAGAVICDVIMLAGPLPLLSLGAVFLLYLPMFPLHARPQAFAALRTTYLLLTIGALTLGSRATSRFPDP
jgi:hypothetical protein